MLFVKFSDIYRLATVLLDDADPLVWKPVGIALKHAGSVDPGGVKAFLAENDARIRPAIRRMAVEKLPA